ncbi:MAG: hypothetical protein ABIA04_14240 [Pseudomonadota bacterium]
MIKLVIISIIVCAIFIVSGILVIRSVVQADTRDLKLFSKIIKNIFSLDFIFGAILVFIGIIFPIFFIINNQD